MTGISSPDGQKPETVDTLGVRFAKEIPIDQHCSPEFITPRNPLGINPELLNQWNRALSRRDLSSTRGQANLFVTDDPTFVETSLVTGPHADLLHTTGDEVDDGRTGIHFSTCAALCDMGVMVGLGPDDLKNEPDA